MYKATLTTVAILMAVALSPVSAFGSFITNGSFEEPAATPGTYDSVGYDSGVGGWEATSGNATVIANTSRLQVSADGASGLPAAAPGTGNTYAAILSYTSHVNVGIKRALDDLEIGEIYTISGYVGGSSGHYQPELNWEVRVGSNTLASGDLTTSWQQFSFEYEANATDGINPELSLIFNGGSSGQQRGVLWDAVTVVPEPGSVSLFLLSGGLFVMRRRSRTH